MTEGASPPVDLTGAEADALIGLLRQIVAELDQAGQAALAGPVFKVAAILRMRQWTDGYRRMTGQSR